MEPYEKMKWHKIFVTIESFIRSIERISGLKFIIYNLNFYTYDSNWIDHIYIIQFWIITFKHLKTWDCSQDDIVIKQGFNLLHND
jgi:hypothetical protein